jgi:shikimate kinase
VTDPTRAADTVRPRSADGIGDTHVVLVGLMGSGKTTVGNLVADRLGRELIDSDGRIETLTGRTVKEILAADGVEALRRHEADALFDALADGTPSVITAAAGVVLDAEHRRRLVAAGALVVWLDADPRSSALRALTGEHRPWLDDDPVGTLQHMHDERKPWYAEVASMTVTVDDLTPEQIADRIVS